ncbi:MAG: thioredoxin-disulfide reductase [Anaerolineaceae bacterium]|nr:thioredoxin-disulfide reductase [Anaerolineaceae bacterium]
MEAIEKVVVLGAGPAGYSAALYAARAELNPLVLTGLQPGGQAALTHTIENYPGFPDGVGGSELGDLFQKQAERFGARMEYDSVTSVDFSKRPFKINTYAKEILAEAVIIATGASPVKLNIPGEDTLVGKGVSYCATCDGWFFKEKRGAGVGGGDSELEEALFLTRYATEVTIIHRRDAFRAGALLQKRMHENPKIKLMLDSVVKEIRGSGKVENLLVSNVKTGEESTFETDGIFIFIGHTPNNDLYKGQLDMDDRNFIKVDSKMHTSVPGVFASGEAADADFKQVVTSAGMGAAAAIEAGRFLSE